MIRRALSAIAFRLGLVGYRWCRRALGGHWEFWYIDWPVCSAIWYPVATCSRVTGRRPGWLARGTPHCEEWPPPPRAGERGPAPAKGGP